MTSHDDAYDDGERSNWHTDAFVGLHYDLHARVDDTVLGRDLTHAHLRAELEKVRPDWVQCDCKGHDGYASYPTTVGVASPGIVKDALRIHRDVTRELGIPLSAHYSGVWDDAAMAAHPDWRRVGPGGLAVSEVSLSGRRQAGRACLSGPYTTEYMIPQLLEIVERYDVDGFWVDGDNWAAEPCYCERCRRLFAAEHDGAPAPTEPSDPPWAAWLLFHRRLFEEHVRRYTAAVHARKPGCLVCSNWMYAVRQPDPITVPVDYLSGDFDAMHGVERAATEARLLDSRGLPWDLMAWTFMPGWQTGAGGDMTKTLPHLCQEVAEVLACGGSVSLYDQPQRTGHLVGWHHDLFADVTRFCQERRDVSLHTVSVPQAAVLHGAAHYYRCNEPLYNQGQATDGVEGALHALLDAGYHADLVTEDTLLRRLCEYPVVVIAEQERVADGIAAALPAYVAAGGRLILSGVDVAETMGDLAGVAAAGGVLVGDCYLPADGGVTAVAGPWRPVALGEARPLLPLLDGQEARRDDAGTPAATIRTIEKGRVVAVHGPVFAAYYRTRYPRLRSALVTLIDAAWDAPQVRLAAPGAAALTLRRQGLRLLMHVLNRGSDPPLGPHRAMVERVPTQGPVVLYLRCAEPRRVYAVPAEPQLTSCWRDGLLTVTLPVLGIHAVVVVEPDE